MDIQSIFKNLLDSLLLLFLSSSPLLQRPPSSGNPVSVHSIIHILPQSQSHTTNSTQTLPTYNQKYPVPSYFPYPPQLQLSPTHHPKTYLNPPNDPPLRPPNPIPNNLPLQPHHKQPNSLRLSAHSPPRRTRLCHRNSLEKHRSAETPRSARPGHDRSPWVQGPGYGVPVGSGEGGVRFGCSS